jgi:hypothetical protein
MVAPRGAAVELQDLRRAAFVDPNDPSVLFVPDPTAAPLDDTAAPPAAYPHAASARARTQTHALERTNE